MKLIRSIPQLRSWISKIQRQGRTIGFVPTMGALHEGHISLIHRARQHAGSHSVVVVSVFVNPTQFNQKSDLKKYPRTLTEDQKMCQKAGVDLIFAPSSKAMYPSDFSTWVNEQSLSLPLCGKSRPGHFRGVCTVALKLFNLVQPDFAIFGQKDAQQAQVIRRLIRDLNLPIQMIIAPTLRERDGLAMSSRNKRLNPQERKNSTRIYQALKQTRAAFRKGNRSSANLKRLARNQLLKIPKLRLDYLELVDASTFQSVQRASHGNLLATAAFLGKTRLIDNIFL